MDGEDDKISTADLWQMYRHPASADAPIPIAIVLCVLREEGFDGQGSERALRFSQGIASELTERGGIDGVLLHFEGDLIPIDKSFYHERLEAFNAADKRSPIYEDMERFVRETYADNLVVPLNRLITLQEEGHIPLPAPLKAKYEALKSVDRHVGGTQSQQADAGSSTPMAERAAKFFSEFDLDAEHEIAGRFQKVNSRNAHVFAKERGFDMGRDYAWAAARRFCDPQKGRPRKRH